MRGSPDTVAGRTGTESRGSTDRNKKWTAAVIFIVEKPSGQHSRRESRRRDKHDMVTCWVFGTTHDENCFSCR